MSIFNNSTTTYGSIVCSELDISSDNNQIIIGSAQLTTLDFDTTTERTLIIPDSAASASFVLSEGGVISGTIEHAETADLATNALDSLHSDTSDFATNSTNATEAIHALDSDTCTTSDNTLLLNGLVNSTTGTSSNTIVQRGTFGQTNLGRTDITALGSNSNILNVKDTSNNNMINVSSDDVNLGSVSHPVQLFLNGSEILPAATPITPSLQDCLNQTITDLDDPMLVSTKTITIKGTHVSHDILEVIRKDGNSAMQIRNNGQIRPWYGLNSAYEMVWYLSAPLANEDIPNYIKFGYSSFEDNIVNGSIVLGDIYTTVNSGFFVSAIRQATSELCSNILVFDSDTKELRYITGLSIDDVGGITTSTVSCETIAIESVSESALSIKSPIPLFLDNVVFNVDTTNNVIDVGSMTNLVDLIVDDSLVVDHTLNEVRIGSVANNKDLLVNDVVIIVNPDLQQIYDNNPTSNLSVDDYLSISRSDNDDNNYALVIKDSLNTNVCSMSTAGTIIALNVSATNVIVQSTVSATTVLCDTIDTDNMIVYKNLVINGDMTVIQRGDKTVSPPNSSSITSYTLDRWQALFSNGGPCVFSISQEETPTTSGSPYFSRLRKYLKYTRGSSSNSSASHSIKLVQNIEGNDVWQFYLGTSEAKPMVLSFWFTATKSGTYCVAVQNSASDRTYKQSFSVVANTWAKHTVYITAITTGTWLTDLNVGLRIVFDLGNNISSQYSSTTSSWTSDNATFVTGSIDMGSSDMGVFDSIGVTGIQLEEGELATNFETIPYAIQLKRCERYYEQIRGFVTGDSNGYFGDGYWGSTTIMYQMGSTFNAEKRIPPTYSIVGTLFIYNRIAGDSSTSVTEISTSRGATTTRTGRLAYTCSGLSGSAGQYCYVYSDDNAYIEISAEL